MKTTRTAAAALIGCASLMSAMTVPAQETQSALESPRWAYEFRAGVFEPDLDLFEVFYGNDSESHYALAGSYRFKDWLEVGGEYSHMRANGVGVLTSSQALGGSVRYQLNPVHVFANFIFQREPDQRVVPYAGVGLAVARYEQEVAQQSDNKGRTDAGYSARAGVRFMLSARRRSTSMAGSPYQRSFIFLEAQELSFEADSIELGGLAYSLGFRMEFDFH
jgi:opacity protein-like surface antigen